MIGLPTSRMCPRSVCLLLALGVGCIQPAPGETRRESASLTQSPGDDAALGAELLVARDLLRRAATGQVIVDPMYAAPRQAPPSATGEARPHARTQALRDSLGAGRLPGDVLVIRLSKPELTANGARITATIDFPSAAQPGRRGYETVEYTLEGSAGAWTIRSRNQLGIS